MDNPPVSAAPDPTVAAADPSVPPVVAANTEFGFRLLGRLAKDTPGKNLFISPFSLTEALSMTLNGAGGDTERAIRQTLSLGEMTQTTINHASELLLPSLTNPDDKVELSVANALWANQGVTFAADFQERSRRFYSAQATTLDFHSPGAVDTINAWVADNTHGKIDHLVSAGDLVQSPAVLTNAVYFHGQWSKPFDKAETQDGPFTRDDGSQKTLPLMSRTGSAAYLETPQFQAVSLPYGTGRMSFLVFLPKPGTHLDTLLSTFTAAQWTAQVQDMHPARMTLVLPRFKVQYEAGLKGPLTALGMGPAFASEADFGPMGLTHGFIGDVIHKAVLEVDEEGTVAAAATGVVMKTLAMPMAPKIVMRVDHPFFCAIRDNTTGTLLFAGAIRDPQ